MDYLMREQSPLNEREWDELDHAVRHVVSEQIVGRRFLSLFGPMGAGVQVVAIDQSPNLKTGHVGMSGTNDDVINADHRIYQKVPTIYRNFMLLWRDIETSRSQGTPLDWSLAEAAASDVADAEDRLILEGRPQDDLPGLLNAGGRHILDHRNGREPGSGFQDIVKGVETLTLSRFHPPYSVVVGPATYALWHRLYGNSGILEIEQIRRIVRGDVYVSPIMPTDDVLVVAGGSPNVDIAIGVDTTVAFLESSAMNHYFRVLETLTLRIKRPGAICHLTPLSAPS